MEEILDDYFDDDDEYCCEENEFPPIRKNRNFRTLPIKYIHRPNTSSTPIDVTEELNKRKVNIVNSFLKYPMMLTKNYFQIKFIDFMLKIAKNLIIDTISFDYTSDFSNTFFKLVSDKSLCKIIFQTTSGFVSLDGFSHSKSKDYYIKKQIPEEILFIYKNRIPIYVRHSCEYEHSCGKYLVHTLKPFNRDINFTSEFSDYILSQIKNMKRYGILYGNLDGSSQSKDELKTVSSLFHDMIYKNNDNPVRDYHHYDLVESQSVYDYISFFIQNKKLYDKKNICWKTGIALYGQPGTGKSEIIRHAAKKLDIPILVLDLKTLDSSTLHYYITQAKLNSPSILLFEDFDRLFDENKKFIKIRSGLSFDNVLNAIDGIDESEGIITLITCNDINKIDSAMVNVDKNEMCSRPGRIDKTFEIKPLCRDSRLLIARDFFNDNIDIEDIVNDGDGYTFAQFRQSCLDKLYGEITKHV